MNLIARITWGLLALATVAVAVATYVVELPEPKNAIAVTEVTDVDAGGAVQRIILPHTSAFRGWKQLGAVRYLAHFDLAAKPDAPLFLYVPAVNRHMSLSLNGVAFFDSGNEAFLAGPILSASVFVPLPAALLTIGRNEFALAFESGALSLHMSRIYVGTEAQLMPNVRLRGFLQERLITMALGAQILLGIGILFAYFCRANDPLFSWLAALVVVASIVSLGLFIDFRTGVQDIRIYAAAVAPAVGFLFIGVAVALVGVRPPHALRIMAALVPAVLFLSILAGVVSHTLAASISFSILFATCIVAAGVVAWGAFLRGNIEARLMLSPFFLICWFAARDIGVSTGLLEGSVLLTPYVRPLFLAAVTSVLMWRLALSLDRLDHANENLNLRLAAREAELAVLHRQERIEAARAVREQERQRLTHDLHDGISGHLVSIIAMAERAGGDVKPIEEAARRALDDLRLVIYSLDLGDRELPLALANFRERLIPQLQRIGVELDWSTAELPEVSGVTPGNALTILRILQEAITNALKHGPARKIAIRGVAMDGNRAAITVENDGARFALSPSGSSGHRQGGHGLENMRRRAAQLQGEVKIDALDCGARVTLLLPMSLPDLQDETVN